MHEKLPSAIYEHNYYDIITIPLTLPEKLLAHSKIYSPMLQQIFGKILINVH